MLRRSPNLFVFVLKSSRDPSRMTRLGLRFFLHPESSKSELWGSSFCTSKLRIEFWSVSLLYIYVYICICIYIYYASKSDSVSGIWCTFFKNGLRFWNIMYFFKNCLRFWNITYFFKNCLQFLEYDILFKIAIEIKKHTEGGGPETIQRGEEREERSRAGEGSTT